MKYGAVTDLLVANDKHFWETKNGANGDGLTFGLASDQKRVCDYSTHSTYILFTIYTERFCDLFRVRPYTVHTGTVL